MAINNEQWISQKITSAKLQNMSDDIVNSADNIHPQYGTLVAYARFDGTQNYSTSRGPFYHIANGSPHGTNKYRCAVCGTAPAVPTYTAVIEIQAFDPAYALVQSITSVVDDGIGFTAQADITFNQSTGLYVLAVNVTGADQALIQCQASLIALDPN